MRKTLATVTLLLAALGSSNAFAQCVGPGGTPSTIASCPSAVGFQPDDFLLGFRRYNGTDVVAIPGQTVRVTPNQLSQLIATGTGGGGSSQFGQAFPQSGVAVGAQSGNNLIPLTADENGNLRAVLAGGISNAASGIAPTSNNTAAVAYAYGWSPSSSTWNQLSLNGSNYLQTAVSSPLPAGTQIIGAVDVDQTSPGTTNAVSLGYVGNTAILTGLGATGDGSERVTVAQDTTTLAGSPPTLHLLVTPDANAPLGISQIAGQPAAVGRGGFIGALRTVNAQDTSTIAGSAPGTASNPSPSIVTVQGAPLMTPLTVTDATLAPTIVSGAVRMQVASPYPVGAIPVTASTTGTTAATTATLAANASAKTWLCQFQIGSTATAAAAGNATVTGIVGGTLNYTMGTGLTPAVVNTNVSFAPCLPSSAINTPVAVVSAAPGSGGVISVSAMGYQL